LGKKQIRKTWEGGLFSKSISRASRSAFLVEKNTKTKGGSKIKREGDLRPIAAGKRKLKTKERSSEEKNIF